MTLRGVLPTRQAREAAPKYFFGGDTWRLAEVGFRPEPTPRAYRGERVTSQAPCYAVMRTVSPVRIHSPVRSIPASRICRSRVGSQPGPAPALRTVLPVCLHSPVRPVPAHRMYRAKVSIQPGRIVPALRSRSPVRLHGPVRPVPSLRTRPEVRVISPVPPVPVP